MPEVRKENSNSLEYVCPECGATFDEGAEDCASCGIEFDWSEEMEYLCPECGTVVDPDQAQCPGCAAKFSMHDDGELLIEYEPEAPKASDEDLLDAAIDESIIRPNGTVVLSEDMEDDVMDRGPTPQADEEIEPEPGEEELESTPADEVEVEVHMDHPRLYPGGFTLLGLVFAVLALMALAASIVVARYDTWIQGAAEESMGENQMMIFYACLTAFAVFIIIAVLDLLRTPRSKPTSRA
ncbi:MAG: zinc ribbon domain-containing protein [Thermoplasmata archaeon]|nr:MAG: zinc ribbon domain-containing protein [Thermoplasmata archaeon]